MAKAKRDEVRQDLLDQLERNGTIGKYYTDLVDDYMSLWETKNKLQADIKKRGAKVEVATASTINIKTNDSVLDSLKVNAQMLKILDSLGIEPANAGGDGDDEM